MMRQRSFWMVAAGMAILLVEPTLRADTLRIGAHAVSNHASIGVWIGAPVPPPLYHPPEHRRVIIPSPWRHRFVRIGPPYREVVVVPAPVVERVVVAPALPVVQPCELGTVTVWITNSNGSQTSVTLTRRGDCYIGPRNEWYTNMPTNEQLRLAYSF